MLKRTLQGVVLSCCCLLVGATSGIGAEYQHTVEAEDISFSWSIDGDNLAGKVSAKTTSWVAVGFNPSQKMKDANYVIGYVKGDEVTIVDEFGTSATGHKSDEDVGGANNVTLVGGSEEGGVTTIEFTIPLDSGDDKDGKLAVDGDTVVLLAYAAGRDSFRSKHKFRTSVTVNLGTGAVK